MQKVNEVSKLLKVGKGYLQQSKYYIGMILKLKHFMLTIEQTLNLTLMHLYNSMVKRF